jgi:hypothetical protein
MPMPAMPVRFQSIASAGATRHRKEVLEGDSLVAISFRCELRQSPITILKEYVEQQKPRPNSLGRSRVPYIPALKGEVLRHQ